MQQPDVQDELAMGYLRKAWDEEMSADRLRGVARELGSFDGVRYLEKASEREFQAKLYRKCADYAWLF